jgi:hypothetical protein
MDTTEKKRTRSRKTTRPTEERRTVRVDTETFAVYPETGPRTYATRIGAVVQYVTNDGARTPSGGKFTSRRVTVRLWGDDRRWVGQFKNDEKVLVILRTLSNE